MEKVYSEERSVCKLAKARPEAIKFLIDYSRSLKILEFEQFLFESNMN